MFKHVLWLCLGFAFVQSANAAIGPEKLQGIAQSMAVLTALTEQLDASDTQTNWENTRIPGMAADRNQVLKESGCVYNLPTTPVETAPGFPKMKIEVSGENCPIYILMEISGQKVGQHLQAGFSIQYLVKNPAAFPDDDLTAMNFTGEFEGEIVGSRSSGSLNLDVTGTFRGNGTSRQYGEFTANADMGVVIKFSGFSFSMAQTEVQEMNIGGESGTFKSETKMEMFSIEENYFIDDAPVTKDDYRRSMSEWKFPFFSFNSAPMSPFKSHCRSEIFASQGVDEAVLQDYVLNDTALPVAPLKETNSCSTNMIRTAEWDTQALNTEFRFGREYMKVDSTLTFGTDVFKAKPLYVVFEERQGRVERASPDFFLVQICEPVKKCN